MGNILQDMISMLTRKKSVIPKADDYIAIARYAGTQERLKQHPKLNSELTEYFDDSYIYRVDHYLAKEAVQNILV